MNAVKLELLDRVGSGGGAGDAKDIDVRAAVKQEAVPARGGSGGLAKPAPPAAHDVSDRYPFSTFCAMLESILHKPSLPERLAVLETFWKSLKAHVTKALGAEAKVDHYPFMRLLLPHLDSGRPTYGLKESKIAQYYTRVLQIPADGIDAQRMLRWKDPSKNTNTTSTHFSDVVYAVLVKRGFGTATVVAGGDKAAGAGAAGAARQKMSVKAMNDALDALSLADAPDRRRTLLMHVLRATTAIEQKWFIRIVVKDMRLHMQHLTVLNRFHPAATPVLNATMDLRKVCEKCLDETVAAEPSSRSLTLFKPFSPMLASVVSKEKLTSILAASTMSLEPKFDGERMLLHYQKSTMKLEMWTRNAKDYSLVYGPKFTTTVLECVRCKESCIIDGEILVYSVVAQAFKPFGTNKTFALDVGDNSEEQFCFMAFDIVWLDGEVLAGEPLSTRREKLKSIVTPKAKHFELVPHRKVVDVPSILKGLDDAVGGGFEGIVLKNNDSTYGFGERKNHWLKLKRDHIEGLADSLDLVILGGSYGTKFGKLHISHFLVGVLGDDHVWYTFAKVGSGYNEAEHAQLLTRLQPHWREYDPQQPPVHFGGWKPAADDVPDFWIDPKHSVVLEIIGYSYTETVKFKVGRTIRFPRVKHIRYDKSIEDADNLAAITKVMDASADGRRLAADLGEGFVLTRQAKKAGARKVAALLDPTPMNFVASGVGAVPEEFTGVSESLKSPEGKAMELCVLQGAPGWPKDALERLIRDHGGAVVANPNADAYLLAGSANNAKVRHWQHAVQSQSAAVLRFRHPSVLHTSWLFACIRARRVLPLAPRYMVFTSPDVKAEFDRTMDKYGDSYLAENNAEMLKAALEEAKKEIAGEQERERARRAGGGGDAGTTNANASTPAKPPLPAGDGDAMMEDGPSPAVVSKISPKKRALAQVASTAAGGGGPPAKRARKQQPHPEAAAANAAVVRLADALESTCRTAVLKITLGLPTRAGGQFFSGVTVSVDLHDAVRGDSSRRGGVLELGILTLLAHGAAVCDVRRAAYYMVEGVTIDHHIVDGGRRAGDNEDADGPAPASVDVKSPQRRRGKSKGGYPRHHPPPNVPLLDVAWVTESLDAGVLLSTDLYTPRLNAPHPTMRELATQLSRTATGVHVDDNRRIDADDAGSEHTSLDEEQEQGFDMSCNLFELS